MKSNEEFISGIYEKAAKQKQLEEIGEKHTVFFTGNIRKIAFAACFVVLIAGISVFGGAMSGRNKAGTEGETNQPEVQKTNDVGLSPQVAEFRMVPSVICLQGSVEAVKKTERDGFYLVDMKVGEEVVSVFVADSILLPFDTEMILLVKEEANAEGMAEYFLTNTKDEYVLEEDGEFYNEDHEKWSGTGLN